MYLLIPSPAMSERIYLMSGSNQGNRAALLQSAIDALESYIPVEDLQCSAVFETAAWGLEEQPAFLNQAISFISDVCPRDLLTEVRRIESELGRQRIEVWGPRTLDLDILFFGNQIIEYPDLTIPHPRIQERRFVLAPMADLAPEFRHPVFGKTMSDLLNECPDHLPVHKYVSATETQS